MRSPADPDRDAPSPEGVNPTFLTLLRAEPLGRLRVLDVGTGSGRLAVLLAPESRHVVGIDWDPAAIDQARERARALGLPNVDFEVADAEAIEYGRFAPDLVVAHLCMSDAIVERASRALAPERVLAFVAIHADHWRETNRRSRFAYDEEQMQRLLARTGFRVEHLGVDRDIRSFRSAEEALVGAAGVEARWRADGRWERYVGFVESGGRTLTRSHLIVKARRA